MYQTPEEFNSLRIRQPITDNNDDDMNSSEYSSPSLTPLPTPPTLVRSINIDKWSVGYNNFIRLNRYYQLMKIFTLIVPIYILGINITTIHNFTQTQVYLYCLIIPILSMYSIEALYKHFLFTSYMNPSSNTLSYYPGETYTYGYIVHTIFKHNQEGDAKIKEYQYWIVINPITENIECIIVENEKYNTPFNRAFIVDLITYYNL